jgi:hypothetical protein
MTIARMISQSAIAMACVGLLLPQSVLAAGTQGATEQAKPPVHDLVIGQRGILRGQVVTAENRPLASTSVLVVAKGKTVAETTTDANGHFAVEGLRTGTYAIGTESTFAIYRTWTEATAPPTAQPAVLLTTDSRVVRGQGRAWDWLTNPFVLTAALGAGIALPIALNNNKGSSS